MSVGKKDIWTFMWRGALGGAIGGLLHFLFVTYRLWPDIPYRGLTLTVVPIVTLFIGLLIGGLAGIIIWWLGLKRRRNLPIIIRLIIGIACSGLLGVCLFLIGNHDSPSSAENFAVNLLWFGLTFGALAGLMAKVKSNVDGSD